MEDVTFKLPLCKKEVTIKGYASYKVTSEIKRIINDGQKMTGSGRPDEKGNVKDLKTLVALDGNARLDAEQRTIELMVVSFDGSTENIYDRISEEREGDVEFLVEKINKVTDKSKLSETEKKS
jgi:hypothetical protein